MTLPELEAFPSVIVYEERTYRIISARYDLLLSWSDEIERRRTWFFWWVTADIRARSERGETIMLLVERQS